MADQSGAEVANQFDLAMLQGLPATCREQLQHRRGGLEYFWNQLPFSSITLNPNVILSPIISEGHGTVAVFNDDTL